MDSQTAIVSPARLRQYADSLEESTKRLRNRGKKLSESAAAASVVWKDEKYRDLHRQLQKCADDVEKFGNLGLRYAEFLREKADLANRYLHRR